MPAVEQSAPAGADPCSTGQPAPTQHHSSVSDIVGGLRQGGAEQGIGRAEEGENWASIGAGKASASDALILAP